MKPTNYDPYPFPVHVAYRAANGRDYTVKLYDAKWHQTQHGNVLRGKQKIKKVFVNRSIHQNEVIGI